MLGTTVLPARARAQLSGSALRVSRGGRLVLDFVEITVSPGTRLGIVGENGRGKSTLLQLLSGALAPDTGTVHRIGSLGVADQEVSVADGRTVGDLIDVELAGARTALRELDDAALALSRRRPGAEGLYADALHAAEVLDAWDADRRVDTALAALGAESDRQRQLSTLSVGQRYRVRLACLLGADHDFLLLDEPTNHLDAGGLDHLTAALRSHRGGVVLVSHDRRLLRDVVTTVLDLDPSSDGRPRTYGGGFRGYQEGRVAERERWIAEHEAQLAEHRRLADDLSAAQNRLSTGWRPDKGTGKHTRATRAPALVRAVHRRREDLAAHTVATPPPPLRLRFPLLPALPGTVLVEVDGVAVAGRLSRPTSLVLRSGDRLVITGTNGSGKSTLLTVLAGRRPPTSGTVRIAPRARVGLLTQESQSRTGRTVRDVYEAAAHGLSSSGAVVEAPVPSLSSLGLVPAADVHRPVAELSVGQQRRLDLALVLLERPHVLLVDEPTNHLSIALVDELTEALTGTAAAVVVATHDRQLLDDVRTWPRLLLAP